MRTLVAGVRYGSRFQLACIRSWIDYWSSHHDITLQITSQRKDVCTHLMKPDDCLWIAPWRGIGERNASNRV